MFDKRKREWHLRSTVILKTACSETFKMHNGFPTSSSLETACMSSGLCKLWNSVVAKNVMFNVALHSLILYPEDLPVQGVSDSFRHLHHLGTSISNKTKSSPPPLYLPSACFRQDAFILRRYHLTSSYSFSTAEPREGDLDPTCAASTDLSGGLALRDCCCQGFGNESSSIPSSLVKLAGWTTCSRGRERVWE